MSVLHNIIEEAHEEGYEAGLDGLSKDECPYGSGSTQWTYWTMGFEAAQEFVRQMSTDEDTEE